MLCIYHSNCADGFASAYVVRMALGSDNVTFHPGIHGEDPPDVTDQDVILVDFSYPRSQLDDMIRVARSITILDHHITAQDSLSGLLESGHIQGVFDMERSGVGITWDWFFPDKPMPSLFEHIQDRDLWNNQLPNTGAIVSAVFAREYDWQQWQELMGADLHQLVMEGKILERKQLKDIREYIRVAKHRIMIDGHDVPAINAPYMWASQAGAMMSSGEPFAVVYWNSATHQVFSLRSTDQGVDVSEIAQNHGGGGHRNAASFRVPHTQDILVEL